MLSPKPDLFNPYKTIKKEPRYYQRNAVDAIWTGVGKYKSVLVSMATGTGKAIVQAMCCQEALQGWPDTGILVLTSVKELIRQNFEELIEIWPEAPASIYSAGLNTKDLSMPIIIAGIQSIYKQAYKIPRRIDLLFIDECQDVSDEEGTMFRRFISELYIINPDMVIIGLSATVFRMRQGMLTEGKNALFEKVVYEYGILQGINDGFLCPPISKTMALQYDVTGVKISKGDYQAGQLEKAVDKDHLTVAVVDELIACGADRKCWLVFCAGIEHAMHVRDEIRSRGVTCETISSKTPDTERDDIFRRYRAGEIRCVTNINVMSKGSNIPQIDLISFLCPSKSPGRVIQWVGRGTRLYPQKADCLILDHAGILAEHGPLDLIAPKPKKKGAGEAPIKYCPECKHECFAGMKLCPECGYEFEFEKAEIDKLAADSAVLSTQLKTETHKVNSVFYFLHKKEGRPDSLRIEYICGLSKVFRQWMLFESAGKKREEACFWWRNHTDNGKAAPNTIPEALIRSRELKKPISVDVRRVGKYDVIVREEL